MVDLAISEFKTVIDLAPEHRRAHLELARHLRDTGRIDEAVEEFNKSVRLDSLSERRNLLRTPVVMFIISVVRTVMQC